MCDKADVKHERKPRSRTSEAPRWRRRSPPCQPRAPPVNKSERLAVNRSKPFWWRRLPASVEDPITLQPVRRLPHPPFNLPSSTGPTEVECLFDPISLSHYLMSSLNFTHPMTRRDISHDECAELDRHLKNHCGVASPRTLFVFTNRDEVAQQSQVEALRREAAGLMDAVHALFETTAPSAAPADRHSHHQRHSHPQHTSEFDTQHPAPAAEPSHAPALAPSSFPSLAHTQMSTSPTPPTSATRPVGRWAQQPLPTARSEDFPGLGGDSVRRQQTVPQWGRSSSSWSTTADHSLASMRVGLPVVRV